MTLARLQVKTGDINQTTIGSPDPRTVYCRFSCIIPVSKSSAATAKPPKLEDKPFREFIEAEFIPSLCTALCERGTELKKLALEIGERPVVGGDCWMVIGMLGDGRRFWLCFEEENISSGRTITLADPGIQPTLLESFLIDERRITLQLLVSRLVQRLNGQKWLGAN